MWYTLLFKIAQLLSGLRLKKLKATSNATLRLVQTLTHPGVLKKSSFMKNIFEYAIYCLTTLPM